MFDGAITRRIAPSRLSIHGGRNPDGDFWTALIRSIDALLRSCCGIREFSDDPACVLRIAFNIAREPATLMDGTVVNVGDPIGCLHFWNEHLPPYSEAGPELRWAAEMRRRMTRSLAALAAHVEESPDWQDVNAFRAHAAFSSRVGILQLYRVTRRMGFEWVPGDPSTIRSLAGSIIGYALTRANNPAALTRQAFFRQTHEIWISRAMLMGLYGPANRDGERRRHIARLASSKGIRSR